MVVAHDAAGLITRDTQGFRELFGEFRTVIAERRVHTRDVLLENVWGHEFSGDRKTVDVHIRWLREKFAGVAPFEIVTVRGIGYRLDRTGDTVELTEPS
jgi:DNA-binding winged helix-turn-helix (wHTH) protein